MTEDEREAALDRCLLSVEQIVRRLPSLIDRHLDSGSADRKLDLILARVEQITMNEQDLQNDLDAIKAAVASVLTAQTAQAATIADLKAQLAAGTPVSQAQLDGLDAEAKAIVATLTPLATPAV